MQDVSFYIAYLLVSHECVIVPGVGAFVALDKEKNAGQKSGLLCPPAQTLGFNPGIRHNDGLLANTLAKGEKISYKEACMQVQRYADEVNDRLTAQRMVQLPWVGKLERTAGGKIMFKPALLLSCNAGNYGLHSFYMPALSELAGENKPVEGNKIKVHPSTARWWWTAAATLALFLIPISLTDQSVHAPQAPQMASFIPLLVENPHPDLVPDFTVEMEMPTGAEEKVETAKETPVAEFVAENTPYYIIIAGFQNASTANEKLQAFRKAGFSEAGIISSPQRHRIYVEKFADKRQAEVFLKKFRREHPQYTDAWLLIPQFI